MKLAVMQRKAVRVKAGRADSITSQAVGTNGLVLNPIRFKVR